MDSYSFTYKDVLKRYERIINKPSKFEIRLLATILLIITIVNITSLCFASESETLAIQNVSNLGIIDNTNYFVFSSGQSVGYVELEKGYIYHVNIPSNFSNGRKIAVCDEVPAVNVTFDLLGTVLPGDSFNYIANNDSVLFISVYSMNEGITITRERIEGYEGAVSDLVENVGISQVWDIFDTGIGFVGVVVLVAFGIFLVVIAIRKMQKGKSEF